MVVVVAAGANPTNPTLQTGGRAVPAKMIGHDPVSRVTVCDPDGKVAARFGGNNPILPGNFIAPHGLWCDSRGDLYIGEVILRGGAVKLLAPLTPHAFQKFKRTG